VSTEANGAPHALTWNIGVTSRLTVFSLSATESGSASAMAWRKIERCEYRTPFGMPVVPEV